MNSSNKLTATVGIRDLGGDRRVVLQMLDESCGAIAWVSMSPDDARAYAASIVEFADQIGAETDPTKLSADVMGVLCNIREAMSAEVKRIDDFTVVLFWQKPTMVGCYPSIRFYAMPDGVTVEMMPFTTRVPAVYVRCDAWGGWKENLWLAIRGLYQSAFDQPLPGRAEPLVSPSSEGIKCNTRCPYFERDEPSCPKTCAAVVYAERSLWAKWERKLLSGDAPLSTDPPSAS